MNFGKLFYRTSMEAASEIWLKSNNILTMKYTTDYEKDQINMITSDNDTLGFNGHNPKHFSGTCTRQQKLILELTFETQ